jgi:predicted kinase
MNASQASMLHFVCGKVASGKTTLARRIADETGAVVICEDEWLTLLQARIDSFEDFLEHSRRLRSALSPHVVQLLKLGVSVVLDAPANVPKQRAWVRTLFEAAGASHALHFIDAPDDVCRAQLRHRNETKPAGVYWGPVSEALFEQITPLFVPPSQDEGFNVVRHEPWRFGSPR